MDPVRVTQARDLERCLAPRLAVEELHRKGRRAHGRGDWLLRHDRALRPLAAAVLKVSGLYGRGVRNAQRLQVRRLRLELPSLPPAFDGFRILHLSDLHIDGVPDLDRIIADHVDRLPVDLCVMTGDYRYEVDGPSDGVYPRMRRVLAAIRSEHGTLGILGNHDAAEMAPALEAAEVRMLINEAVEVRRGGDSIWVAGVDDPHYYGADDLEAALALVPPGSFRMLLAHTPELYQEAAAAGISLYLCGHTHAGQICLPRLGPVLLNAKCPRAYASGRWRHGAVEGYTSAGAGASLLPVRYGCPPEVTVMTILTSSPPPANSPPP